MRMDPEVNKALRVLAAGLSRFFDEGHCIWSQEQFRKLLMPPLMDGCSDLERQLKQWEAEGAIKRGIGNTYLMVVRPIDP